MENNPDETLIATHPHSVELSRNAKGEYSYKIKVRSPDIDSLKTEAISTLEEVDALLKAKFLK